LLTISQALGEAAATPGQRQERSRGNIKETPPRRSREGPSV